MGVHAKRRVVTQAAEAALAAAADVESQLTGRAKPEGEAGIGGEDLRRQRTAEILQQVRSLRRREPHVELGPALVLLSAADGVQGSLGT